MSFTPANPDSNRSNKKRNQAPSSSSSSGPKRKWHSKKSKSEIEAVDAAWKQQPRSSTYAEKIPTNSMFEKYYKLQGIVGESEWDEFISALRTKLPVTFRLSSINGLQTRLKKMLESGEFDAATMKQTTPKTQEKGTEEAASTETTADSTTVSVESTPTPTPTDSTSSSSSSSTSSSAAADVDHRPKPLIWYPDNMGWYLPVSKTDLKSKHFLEFRKWLMQMFDQGNLNRQEAVSMIPPLLLDAKPHHFVLDMCAAPGSKTAQLLEALHQPEDGSSNTGAFSTPKGFVIANDADPRRAYMLVHQLKRLGSPAFLVTTHEGQHYPNIFSVTLPPSSSSHSSSSASLSLPTDPLIQFDRILCDVPCSGDGTLRKNLNLWKNWSPNYGQGLHALQILIATRCAYLLKVDGYMVYSTCSFNPLENEAVVAELIRKSNGGLEVVDVSDKLVGLKRMAGLSDWKVLKNDATEVNWEAESAAPSTKYRKTMFPPSKEEAATMHLEHCVRVLPHHQDTGGFFIVLLRKQALLPGQKERKTVAQTVAATVTAGSDAATATAVPVVGSDVATEDDMKIEGEADAKDDAEAIAATAAIGNVVDDEEGMAPSSKSSNATYSNYMNEDPFRPLKPDVVSSIVSFYGMHDTLNTANFFSRSDDSKKCYFVGPAIAGVLLSNRNPKLKIVHSGSRCFERTPNRANGLQYECEYRIVQEGADAVFPHVTKQIIELPLPHFMILLNKESISLRAHEGRPEAVSVELLKLKPGCVIAKYSGAEAQAVTNKPLLICCWKTNNSLTAMMAVAERQTLASLLTKKPVNKVETTSTSTATTTASPSADETIKNETA